MFLRYFRKFKTSTPLLLSLAGMVLWADGFLWARPVQDFSTPGAALLYQVVYPFAQHFPLAAMIVGLVFLVAQGIYLNHIVTSYGLIDRQNYFTAILYIVLMSSHPEMLSLHPLLFSNFFLMICLHQIFKVYAEETVLVEVFNVGMLIAVGGLFYLPALMLFLLLIISLFVFYIIDLRSFLAAMLGLAAPFFFAVLYFFLTDQLPERVTSFISGFSQVSLPDMSLSMTATMLIIFLSVISILSFSRLAFSYIPDRPIRIRKRYWVIVHYFPVALLTVFFSQPLRMAHLALVFIPLSVGLAAFFQQLRSRMLPEAIFLLLLLIILAGKWAAL